MNGSMRPNVTIRPLAKSAGRAQAPMATSMPSASVPACRRRRLVQGQDHHAGHERRHGADRQVEPAARDHEGRADRDDGDEGRSRHHVEEVRGGEEIGIDERARDDQHDQGDERRERPHVEA